MRIPTASPLSTPFTLWCVSLGGGGEGRRERVPHALGDSVGSREEREDCGECDGELHIDDECCAFPVDGSRT